jgi:electron transfer flavoprotein beta subunit
MSQRPGLPLSVLVCLKPVQLPSVRLRLDDSGRSPRAGDAPVSVNPADLSALALALTLGNESGAALVTIVTAGPDSWEEILRLALASGAQQAFRIWNDDWPVDRWEGTQDGSATHTAFVAKAVAESLVTAAPDLVLTGESSLDTGHGCFGAFLAQALGATYAHRAAALTREDAGWRTRVKLERGYTQEMVLQTPIVLSVSSSLPQPAYPALPAWILSRSAVISLRASALRYPVLPETTLRPPRPRVKQFAVPDSALDAESRIRALVGQPVGGGGQTLPAGETPAAQAEAIVKLLRERGYWTRPGGRPG